MIDKDHKAVDADHEYDINKNKKTLFSAMVNSPKSLSHEDQDKVLHKAVEHHLSERTKHGEHTDFDSGWLSNTIADSAETSKRIHSKFLPLMSEYAKKDLQHKNVKIED